MTKVQFVSETLSLYIQGGTPGQRGQEGKVRGESTVSCFTSS